MGLENRQGVFKLLQRLFGAARAASKVSQPFDALPLTHNHHASVKHAPNGDFQQRVSQGLFHNAETITQLPGNQSQAAAFVKVPVDILRLLGSKKQRAPSAGAPGGVGLRSKLFAEASEVLHRSLQPVASDIKVFPYA